MTESCIIFYDGSCALCHICVRWGIRLGAGDRGVKFAPLQGITATNLRATGVPIPLTLDAMVFLKGDDLFHGPFAFYALAAYLRVPFNLLGWARYLPSFISWGFYRVISERRISLFGKALNACPVIEPARKIFFLD
jgi:predicted DCC family thiol-disulfide oxidoreductase YuxK